MILINVYKVNSLPNQYKNYHITNDLIYTGKLNLLYNDFGTKCSDAELLIVFNELEATNTKSIGSFLNRF